MDKLRELVSVYEELTNDFHQQFVGEFEYERLIYDVRREILDLERTINFGFYTESSSE